MQLSPHLRAFAWLASGLLIGVVATGLAARHVLVSFFPSWDQRNLTQELAQNSVDLLVLQNLRAGKTSEAIEVVEFELDARALSLGNLIQVETTDPVIEANRDKINCRLAAIARYRAALQSGPTHKYPEIAEMAASVLARSDCRKSEPAA